MQDPREYQLLQHLSQYVTDHKKEYINQVLARRTRHVTVVLEDIFQSQNSSAAIRTCECLGIQDVHIIEQQSKYSINKKVLRGADKWMTLLRYRQKGINNTEVCFSALRSKGYKILCADPDPAGDSIMEMDVPDQPLAFVFGNELSGLSEFALRQSDHRVRIPVFGFTESYNISVSVAMVLCAVMDKLWRRNFNLELPEDDKDKLKLSWYRKIVRRSEIVEREFLRTFV